MMGTERHSSAMWNVHETEYYFFYGFKAVCQLADGLL